MISTEGQDTKVEKYTRDNAPIAEKWIKNDYKP